MNYSRTGIEYLMSLRRPARYPLSHATTATFLALLSLLSVPEQSHAQTSVQRAVCGPGSAPETGLQGEVSLADRQSGRSQQGYNCNLELLGQYRGEGASWINPFYKNCAYVATAFGGTATKKRQGVQVIDLSDPTYPQWKGSLTSTAMYNGPWESLKVNERRGLMAGVAAGPIVGAALIDVYDLAADCTKPQLLNPLVSSVTMPANVLGHEGNWTPDGMTYWSSGAAAGTLTAIDMADPGKPRILYTQADTIAYHGFSFSDDGTRMYLATINPAGMTILDVSDVQSRQPVPAVRFVASVSWNANGNSQQTIPVISGGKPYVIVVDEMQSEAVHIVDISDERNPKVAGNIRLEIHLPQYASLRSQEVAGNNTIFGYEGHYCTVDHKTDPTALACSFFQSGVRVFDMRNISSPTEIAYYNPPAPTGQADNLQASEHVVGIRDAVTPNLTAGWCSSPPRFVGTDQIWVTCQDNGVLALHFTNNVYKRVTNSFDPRQEYRDMDD